MAESWSLPFLDAFGAAKNMHVYEVFGVILLNDYWFGVGCKVPITVS